MRLQPAPSVAPIAPPIHHVPPAPEITRELGAYRWLQVGRVRRIWFKDGVHWNVDLRQLHDALFGEADPDGVVEFVFEKHAILASDDPKVPAVRTGTLGLAGAKHDHSHHREQRAH